MTAALGQFDGSLTTIRAHETGPDGRPNPTYRCLFPSPPPPGAIPTCAEAGVLGALAGVMGSLMAMEVIREIVGFGESLVGRLLMVDARSMRFDTVRLRMGRGEPVERFRTINPLPSAGEGDLQSRSGEGLRSIVERPSPGSLRSPPSPAKGEGLARVSPPQHRAGLLRHLADDLGRDRLDLRVGQRLLRGLQGHGDGHGLLVRVDAGALVDVEHVDADDELALRPLRRLDDVAAATSRPTTKAKSRVSGWKSGRSSFGFILVGFALGGGSASRLSSKATSGPFRSSAFSTFG